VELIRKQNYLDSDTLDWCDEIEQRVDALFASAHDNAQKVWQDYTDSENGSCF